MVETKEVLIGDKNYHLKCSILTTETFEKATGKNIGKVLSSFIELGKHTDDEQYLVEHILPIELSVMELAYYMILEAKRDGFNQDFNITLDDFKASVSSLNKETLKGVLAVAQSVFPRSLSKRTEG